MKKKNPPEPIEFPEGPVCMSGVAKEQTIIPDDFPITYCRPSRRGMRSKSTVSPRKKGRPLSWEVAEALAPDAGKPYHEDEVEFIRSVPLCERDIAS